MAGSHMPLLDADMSRQSDGLISRSVSPKRLWLGNTYTSQDLRQ